MVMHVPPRPLFHEIRPRARHVYRRPPEPVHFPESEEMPETNRHLELRTALYLILKRELADKATIGSDQFVYWDPTTSKKRLAPDVFVRLGPPHEYFRTWKIWERGAPHLAVEVGSRSDEDQEDWDDKLQRFRAAGISEVVRFDEEDREGRVRVWDLINGDLVERDAGDPDLMVCEALGLFWVVFHHPTLGLMLRLARDREGRDLLPTPDEAESVARADATSARADAARANEKSARLEAELAALREKLEARPKKARTSAKKRR